MRSVVEEWGGKVDALTEQFYGQDYGQVPSAEEELEEGEQGEEEEGGESPGARAGAAHCPAQPLGHDEAARV